MQKAQSMLRCMNSFSNARRFLTIVLVLAFFALSFNAYACVVPLFETTASGMANGCSEHNEQPVRQFCDAFTTLSIESAGDFQQSFDYQSICAEDTASISCLRNFTSLVSRPYDHPAKSPPQDLLLKISVLRI
jgi:hypothetical protein